MKKTKNKTKTRVLIGVILLLAALVTGVFLTDTGGKKAETITEVMKDAVLHETNKVSLFGILDVNPAVISGMVVTAILLIAALFLRIFVIPRFKTVPGKLQLLLEELVGFFDGLAKTNGPAKNKFLGAYIFGAGCYIFFGTLFELIGWQWTTVEGTSISLSAPLSDINAAIALGCASYLAILCGGLVHNGFRGMVSALKDFSLPISMSFRLFGALLSGLLVTELVYYSLSLSFVLPVAVGVLFTLLHAIIQTYVLTMLVSVFYGEATEPHPAKQKHPKNLPASPQAPRS